MFSEKAAGLDLLVQADSEGSLSARWKPLWQGLTLEPLELALLLGGQGEHKPSPCFDLKVPGLQARWDKKTNGVSENAVNQNVQVSLPGKEEKIKALNQQVDSLQHVILQVRLNQQHGKKHPKLTNQTYHYKHLEK